MPTRRVGMQVAGPGQHSRPAARSHWFATVLSGSTTLGRQRGQSGSYGATAARCQCRGPPTRHRYRPSDALPDLQLRHLSEAHRRRFLALMVGAPESPAPAPPGGPPSTFLSVDGGCSRIFSSGTSRGPTVDVSYR
jgi:hypothetical protein